METDIKSRLRGNSIDSRESADMKNKKNNAAQDTQTPVGQNSNDQKDEAICPYCHTSAEGSSIECAICEQWFHFTCAKISVALQLEMKEDEEDQITWNCKECNRGAKKIMGHITKLTIRMKKQEDKLDDIQQQLTNMKDDQINRRPNQEINKDSIKDIVEDQITEFRERELRKENLIIHNIPEPNKSTTEQDRKDDTAFVKCIARELLIENTQIKSTQRLGQKGEKPRLTKITVGSVAQKRDILQKARNLRESIDPRMQNIFISPDLSKRAREEGKALRDELHRRRNLGETDLIIKKGKIVLKETVQASTQHTSQKHGGARPKNDVRPINNTAHTKKTNEKDEVVVKQPTRGAEANPVEPVAPDILGEEEETDTPTNQPFPLQGPSPTK